VLSVGRVHWHLVGRSRVRWNDQVRDVLPSSSESHRPRARRS
jgi:hypothetical protein